MIPVEDCSCADTTEPSNLTSLRSDDATSAINSDVNVVCTKTIDKRNEGAVEKPKGIFSALFSNVPANVKANYMCKAPEKSRRIFFSSQNCCQFFFLKYL